MKKLLSFILILVVILCSFPITNIVAEGESIIVEAVPSETSLVKGDTFTVDFNITTNKGFNTLGLEVGYDDEVLEVVCPNHVNDNTCSGARLPVTNMLNTSPDGARNLAACSAFHNVNPYRIMWSFGEAEEDVVSTGCIATLTFRVKDDAKIGATTITLNVDQASCIENGRYAESERVGVSADVFVELHTHIYTSDCDVSCNICEHIRVAPAEHLYDNACDSLCNNCEYVRTVPEHIFTNDCDSTCNICEYQRIPEPHKVGFYTFENAINYPFTLTNGIYSSTNKGNSSSATATLTAKSDGLITIKYHTSTEANYDKFVIKLNGTTKVNASGETSWTTVNIPVNAGDMVYITYSKDGSQSSGSDVVKFELSPTAGYELAEDLEPTCEDDVKCSICDEVVKAALGHTYSGDCDTSCNVCEGIRVAPEEHFYDNDCDTDCNICDTIRIITHKYEWIIDKEENCGVNGIKHEECTVCYAKRNVNTVISATGEHIYDNDCDTGCNICDTVRIITHKYEWIIDKEENCGVDGTKHEECTVCHIKRNENTLIFATGEHVYDGVCDSECNVCNEIRTAPDHTYFSMYLAQEDIHYKLCAVCGYKDDIGEHIYDNDCDANCNICSATRTVTHMYEWVIDSAENCGVNGIKHEECTVCHLKQSENTVIPAIGNHIYDNDCDKMCNVCNSLRLTDEHNYVWVIDKQESCSENGIKHCECSVCGIKQFENTVISATGNHNYDNDCDTDCNVCKQTRVVSGHIYDNDCDKMCNVCNSLRLTDEHNYVWVVDKHESCGENGIKHCECSVCGVKQFENTVISATGNHNYDNDCDTDCNICGATRTTTHTYDNACDTKCNICGFERVTNHSYGDDKVCDECGYKDYTPGDVNGDGVIDLKDVVYLSQYVAGWEGIVLK